MITVTLFGKPEETLHGFEVEGHAGYAASGKDIICSAVSALAVTAANSIETLTGDDPQVRGGEDGYLSVNVEAPSNETQLLLRSFALGIQEIREAYGHNFINIRYKED
ncbi:MAG: ribosomal-processing cysteine protease Prp [Lachnospiraceae bacterium]|nr:ribosomal-processing cysteine protease Prp [Lachnospiraceae bacterium]